jgi:hypothetical protein
VKGNAMPSKTNVPGRTRRAFTFRTGVGRTLQALREVAASWRAAAPFQRQLLNGMQDGRPIYGGTVTAATKAKRRARNKVARRSRRINRKAARR